MVSLNFPGRFIRIIRCEERKNPFTVISEIIKEFSEKGFTCLRLDMYGSSNYIITVLVNYSDNSVIIIKHDSSTIYDFSQSQENILENIRETLGDTYYVEVYALNNNEFDMSLLIISEIALKDKIRQPYIRFEISQLLSYSENTWDIEKTADNTNTRWSILDKIKKYIDPDYSRQLSKPTEKARILAFSKDYIVYRLSKVQITEEKCVDLFNRFLSSKDLWALLVRFDDNEIWVAKKNNSALGLIVRYKDKTYSDFEECVKICREIHKNIRKYNNITIILYKK